LNEVSEKTKQNVQEIEIKEQLEDIILVKSDVDILGAAKVFHTNKSLKIESSPLKNGQIESKLNKKAWNNYLKIQENDSIKAIVTFENPEKRILHSSKEDLNVLSNSIITRSFWALKQNVAIDWGDFADEGDRESATMLGEGWKFADKGHTYPNIVKGLNTASFGVYNCDQIYRVGKTATISPVYVDENTNTPIGNLDVVCLMDLNYNGSFSFDPNYVTCNPEGKNALLLFTKDNKKYIILPENLSKENLSKKSPKLKMKEVTKELNSSDDLALILGL